jgi:hypothetical protein
MSAGGPPYHVRRHRWTPSEESRLLTLCAEGKGYTEMAQALGLPNYCVRDKLARHLATALARKIAPPRCPADELACAVIVRAAGRR